jgi:hypothetical protein
LRTGASSILNLPALMVTFTDSPMCSAYIVGGAVYIVGGAVYIVGDAVYIVGGAVYIVGDGVYIVGGEGIYCG